jgi:hypothetical protein
MGHISDVDPAWNKFAMLRYFISNSMLSVVKGLQMVRDCSLDSRAPGGGSCCALYQHMSRTLWTSCDIQKKLRASYKGKRARNLQNVRSPDRVQHIASTMARRGGSEGICAFLNRFLASFKHCFDACFVPSCFESSSELSTSPLWGAVVVVATCTRRELRSDQEGESLLCEIQNLYTLSVLLCQSLKMLKRGER